jgi:hypothetical protein
MVKTRSHGVAWYILLCAPKDTARSLGQFDVDSRMHYQHDRFGGRIEDARHRVHVILHRDLTGVVQSRPWPGMSGTIT